MATLIVSPLGEKRGLRFELGKCTGKSRESFKIPSQFRSRKAVTDGQKAEAIAEKALAVTAWEEGWDYYDDDYPAELKPNQAIIDLLNESGGKIDDGDVDGNLAKTDHDAGNVYMVNAWQAYYNDPPGPVPADYHRAVEQFELASDPVNSPYLAADAHYFDAVLDFNWATDSAEEALEMMKGLEGKKAADDAKDEATDAKTAANTQGSLSQTAIDDAVFYLENVYGGDFYEEYEEELEDLQTIWDDANADIIVGSATQVVGVANYAAGVVHIAADEWADALIDFDIATEDFEDAQLDYDSAESEFVDVKTDAEEILGNMEEEDD